MKKVYSWTRFAGRSAAAAVGLEGTPTKLMFVVTKRCHSKCVYCDIWKVKDIPGALDAELTLDEVRAFARANPYFQWIDFTGGEPTDRPDFVEVVQAFEDACPDLLLVHFPTNGIATKRIRSVVDQLAGRLRSRLIVTVSIDGPPEINDRLRGIRNDFAHAIETFAALRERLGAENTYVGMTLHGHTGTCGKSTSVLVEETFASINGALAKMDRAVVPWSSFHINIPHFSQHYYGNVANDSGTASHRQEIAQALRQMGDRAHGGGSLGMRAVERVYRSEAQRYLATGRTNIPCSALLSTAYLSERGDVFPCTIWNRPLGNVRNHHYRLMPILEAARRAGVRRQVQEGACPNCWTPCEAYPAIAASPLRALAALARPAQSR